MKPLKALTVGYFALGLSALTLLSTIGLSACTSSTPPNRSVLISQAQQHLQKGHYQQAQQTLSQALQLDPNNSQVHVQLGWVYLYTHNLEKTAEQLDWLEDQKQTPPQTRTLKGAFYEKLEAWDEAEQAYRLAVKSNPQDTEAHLGLGRVLLHNDGAKPALVHFNQAHMLSPKRSDIAFQRCRAFRQLKQYRPALLACQQAHDWTTDENERANMLEVIEAITLLTKLDEKP